MKNFIKLILASFLGTFISLMFVALFLVVGALFFIKSTVNMTSDIKSVFEDININRSIYKKNNSLLIKLKGNIVEYANMERGFNNTYSTNIRYILKKIDYAKKNKDIHTISLEFENPFISLTHASIIREKLKEFQKTNKKIYSYSNYYSQNQYYLASVSDSIFINKLGFVDFKGLHIEWLFFKRIQQNYGIKMDIIRHGKYKSAVEPFISNKFSKENRYQLTQLVSSLWAKIITDVSLDRNISKSKLNYIADNLSTYSSEVLIKNKMVDGVLTKHQYDKLIEKTKLYSSYDYDSSNDKVKTNHTDTKKSNNEIALVYAVGTISYYKNDTYKGGIYADQMSEILKDLTDDNDVRAIVIRIDSPGGDANASEDIYQQIKLARKTKPIVISMSNNAASGGYYIACAGSYIFAEETTITGSIGVWGAIANAQGFFNKIGVDTDYIQTNKNSFTYSLFKGSSKDVKNVIRKSIQNVYDVFVDRVSTSRGLTHSYVDNISQGRIWTGLEAFKLKLVDEIGGIEKAIKKAAQLSDISDYKVKEYPKYKFDIKSFLFNNILKKNMTLNNIYSNYKLKNDLDHLLYLIKEPNGIKALNTYLIK